MTIKPVKATLWGGLLFLVPLTIAVLILGKLFGFMYKVALPFSRWIPLDSVAGIAIVNIVTVFLILIISFLAGHVATSAWGHQLRERVESALLIVFPRYTFIKGLTESMRAEGGDRIMRPVRVDFDDNAQIAFEVERNGKGQVTLFLPGSPDPWSGSVVYVPAERVTPLSADVTTILRSLRSAGRGSGALVS